MKFRKDFVTNSSSSSFICSISGNAESGYDCGPEDVGMVQCTNDHIFYEQYQRSESDISLEECRPYILQALKDYLKSNPGSKENILAAINGINALESGNYSDIMNLLDENHLYKDEVIYESDGIGEIKCPICSFHNIEQDALKRYIEKTTGKTFDEYKAEALNQFDTLEDFENFLKEDNK